MKSEALSGKKAPAVPTPAPALMLKPPFFNTDYLASLKEAHESRRIRFVSDTLKRYDVDKKDSLLASEMITLTRDLYATLGLSAPKETHAADVCKRELGDAFSESGTIGGVAFETCLYALLKAALFKHKISGAEAGGKSSLVQPGNAPSGSSQGGYKASPRASPQTSPGVEALAECIEFPNDAKVMVTSYRRCYVKYAAGAKRLGLKSFVADRFPPRSGLTVVGSFQFKGASSVEELKAFDTYIVGVVDEEGKGYLIDSLGIQAAEQQIKDTEGNVRARAEAIEMGACLTVRKLVDRAADGSMSFRKGSGW